MSNTAGTVSQVIALPKGGGALQGMGEKFAPDLHTGTGNFSVPIAVPPGRNGLQPQLALTYSTGKGNGPFGLGWNLNVPGVTRKTSKGVPRYEGNDTYLLSGAEDLVLVRELTAPHQGYRRHYRPRTEGLFARIVHHHDATSNYWEVQSKDGLVSCYGTPAAVGTDPAVVADPLHRHKIFAWKLTHTVDAFGNRIEYEYERDAGQAASHQWDQLYLKRIRYVDYPAQGDIRYVASVTFAFAARPDPFSDYRAGFEIRTTKRCTRIEIRTHTDAERLVRAYDLVYLEERNGLEQRLPSNGVSLLSQIKVTSDGGNHGWAWGYGTMTQQSTPDLVREALTRPVSSPSLVEEMPPLEFRYTQFEPARRRFLPLHARDLPSDSLANPHLELVDLFGNGLPDILEMNGTVRYWRNLGAGQYDQPRDMREAPAGIGLADQGVQLIDANGDGRMDLLVTTENLAGYYPLQFGGLWDRRSFQPYSLAPSFDLEDPEVRLVDLDGDGVTDAIRSGSRFECFFNDPHEGWKDIRQVERRALEDFPNINFSDPRVKWADMSGDGLQDIVLVHDGSVAYWPNLGYGNWGKRLPMRHSPRFSYGYDARRILVGDVDGDGLADLVYVDHHMVTLWINQSGNGWSDPLVIQGTPAVSDIDSIRLADMLGTGVSGILWSQDAAGPWRHPMYFLDFMGGLKPYLLSEMDNHIGAVTKVEYAPSTRFYLQDQQHPTTCWQTPLPFPVQVVERVEVIDALSGGKLTTRYRYHHGYWDGAEREFRGFGMVEQFDSETRDIYNQPGLHGAAIPFTRVDDPQRFSPPTLTRTWFHQGPIGEEFGDWQERDLSGEYWAGDPQVLKHVETVNDFLKGIQGIPPRRVQRDALRTLRGSILRTELYALDGSEYAERPYTVTESLYGLREESALVPHGVERLHIFFPHLLAQRTTQWERGDDPITRFTFTGEYDAYGQPCSQRNIAVPRGRDYRATVAASDPAPAPYLGTNTVTVYATPSDTATYIMDRVARTTTFEIPPESPAHRQDIWTFKDLIATPTFSNPAHLIGQSLHFYDGPAFEGLAFGEIGVYGALVRTETLVLTEDILHQAYRSSDTVASPPEEPPYLVLTGPSTWTTDYPQGFRDQLPPLAGYHFQDGNTTTPYTRGYFVSGERRHYDFHDHPQGLGQGLLLAQRDPLGHNTTITYDAYCLLPTQVTDAAGLTTQATYDYRVLQPQEVTEPNGNRTAYAFTPLGLLERTAVMGKVGENVGDTMGAPGTRFVYDFQAFERRQPLSVHTIKRVHHVSESDVPQLERGETIESLEYSDGFGRMLQTRTQAEDVRFGDPVFGDAGLPAEQPGNSAAVGRQRVAGDPPNVVVSGWQSYDNKGRVVEKHEPFFSTGWDYAPPQDEEFGQKATMFYDPLGRVIRTVNPNRSEQRVIYGIPLQLDDPPLAPLDTARFSPTPWETYTYDANDNAGRTHRDESLAYQQHWNTPASAEMDALGRTIKTVARNGPDPASDWYATRSTYDIRGNLLAVADSLGRVVFRHIYDLANRPLRVDSLDAGTRRSVLDAAGNVTEGHDSKGALVLHAYDVLNRPIRLWARDASGQLLTLRQRLVYGDSPDAGLTTAQATAANLLGKPYQHYDEAGLLTLAAYDFKGNLLDKRRQVVADAALLAGFTPRPSNWVVQAFRVNWEPLNATPLEAAAYTTTLTYDALNRIKTMQYPQDVGGTRKTLRPHYNRAGALERVELDGTLYVERITYNARGQRALIAYGNGVMARHAYDPLTFRLVRLRSEPYRTPALLTYHPMGAPLQDLAYRYDLAGNILTIQERTPGYGVLNNPDALTYQGTDPVLATLLTAGNALLRYFAYDPLYRLLSASGRACKDIPSPRPWSDDSRCGHNSRSHGTPTQDNAPGLTAMYREAYRYDPAGNLLSLHHSTTAAPWVRHFGMGGLTPQQWNQEWPNHVGISGEWTNPPGNCLTHVGDNHPTIPQSHVFDANGNLIRETTSRHFEWDHSDRMRVYRTQVANTEPSLHTQYLYDAGGQRVKKLVRKKGGQVEVTVYIDGIFEYHRLVRRNTTRDNNTLHVMDNQSRIALVRVGNSFPGDVSPPVKYHLGDHLGSSSVVVNASGAWINREEYFPYGETSFGSFAKKRYRFTGQERDEESGLYYHGARYYAPWLVKWVSCDPAKTADGLNPYVYTRNNPMRFSDPSGMMTKEESSRYIEGMGERNPNLKLHNQIFDLIHGPNPQSSTGISLVTKDPTATEHVLLAKGTIEAAQVTTELSLSFIPGAGLVSRLPKGAQAVIAVGSAAMTGVQAGEAITETTITGEPLSTRERITRAIQSGIGFMRMGWQYAKQLSQMLQIGAYRDVRGHHVHQAAAYGPGDARTTNPNYQDAVSVGHSPAFSRAQHRMADAMQRNLNRGYLGLTVHDPVVGKGMDTVHIGSAGSGQKAGQPNPWFEDVKAFFALRAAGMSPSLSLDLVDMSTTQSLCTSSR